MPGRFSFVSETAVLKVNWLCLAVREGFEGSEFETVDSVLPSKLLSCLRQLPSKNSFSPSLGQDTAFIGSASPLPGSKLELPSSEGLEN